MLLGISRASFRRSQFPHSLPTPPVTNLIASAARNLNYIRESPSADLEWARLPTPNQSVGSHGHIRTLFPSNQPDQNRFPLAADNSFRARNPISSQICAKACKPVGFGMPAGPSLLSKLQPVKDSPPWVGRLHAALRGYSDSVPEVWIVANRRRHISSLNSPEAVHLWKTVLDVVLSCNLSLEPIHEYAVWLLNVHSIQLPDLYYRVVAHYLRNGKHHWAFYWHLRLMPDFDPGIDCFGSLLQEFINTSNVTLQRTLMSLYTTSLHRGLYDRLIPYLFDRGKLQLCGNWRRLLLRHYDVPQTVSVSRPFLRFLASYFPDKALELEEKAATDPSFPISPNHTDGSNFWELISRTPDNPKCEASRGFNDALGARWLASSWIPLDISIHALGGFGVRNIGPLSLQSIALREGTPAAVSSRLEQLQKLGIDIGPSTYARAVRYFAGAGHSDLLSQLLQSDIHPNVFDDFNTQGALLRAIGGSSNSWHTRQLLLAVQPAAAEDSIESTSNELLSQYLARGQCRPAIGLLDDMRAMGLNINPQTLYNIHEQLMRLSKLGVSAAHIHGQQISDTLALAKRVALLPGHLPSKFWQMVMFSLGKFGHVDELERLALSLVDGSQNRMLRHSGRLSVHLSDCPATFTINEACAGIPPDLPVTNIWHPIRRIFLDHQLQASIVRWGFRKGLNSSHSIHHLGSPRAGLRPSDFHVARGVRLLKELASRGMPIKRHIIRNEVIRCIARYSLTARGTPREEGRQVDFDQISMLFNFAFDDWLLPGAMELRDLIGIRRGRLARL
ncbi:hypothetical protein ACRALDRAFT_1063546 [Sodiomyces alcalophilus JCM 7366]|uniref:uncharacterized protein n=1 Tax=Sodiomyces alcalophilus JCM 7366 TaxID=591952 RepID=UPI0039B594D3